MSFHSLEEFLQYERHTIAEHSRAVNWYAYINQTRRFTKGNQPMKTLAKRTFILLAILVGATMAGAAFGSLADRLLRYDFERNK